MSLLEPFSKPRWRHPKVEVRLAAVDEIDDPAVLLEVLQTDEDDTVRGRALARIDDPATLDALIDNPPEGLAKALLEQACGQRLQQMLGPDGAIPAGADDGALLRITHLTVEPALIEAAIARIPDPQKRMQIALEHSVSRTRLCAARSLDDIELLQELMHQARHKDKAVYRHCRERVDQHLAEQRAVEERRESLARLAEEAAALRAAVDSPDYRARYLSLQQRWKQLCEHAGPEEQERIQGDLETCAKRVEKRAAEQAAEEEERALTDQAGQTFLELLDELNAIGPETLATEESAHALESRLNTIEERWVAALRHAQPASEQTEACKSALNHWRAPLLTLRNLAARSTELERLLKSAERVDAADFKAIQKLHKQALKLSRSLTWPAEFKASEPAHIEELRTQRQQLEQRLAELQDREQKILGKVEKAFADFREELATNHYRNADRALNRLRNLLRQLPPARQDHFQHELRPLLVRLQEIHDWQGFAIEPKKQELIGQMRALIGSSEDPDTVAAKIKALQDEWKSLGPLSPKRDQELWQEFHAAADEAWAPCAAAFEQRAAARKQLFRQRMELVSQLKEYERKIAWPDLEDPDPDLPSPDWKMVRKTLNTARKAFAELGPVDRKQERKSHRALDKVCNRIYAHLEKEYGRNIERKKALVAEAQALVEVDDLRQAIDRAKAVQREWKAVGLTPQRVDRGLWKDFRKACDAVFNRLGEERDQRQAERRAAAQARAEQVAARKRAKQESWEILLNRLRGCALKPEDPDAAAALWGEDGDLPKGIDGDALEAWWNDGPGTPDEGACRTACIALEVLAGIDSPPEEKEARMAYQMQRLVEGMGSGPGNSRARLLDGVNEFIMLRPSQEWIGRFLQAAGTAAGVGLKT